jgi:hypothetical protein
MRTRETAWAIAAGGVGVMNVGFWVLSRVVEGLQESDGFILVAYAEPWRTLARIASLILVGLAFRREKNGPGHGLRAASLLAVSALLSIELSSSLTFRSIAGELENQRLGVFFSRQHLPVSDADACIDADLSGVFSWYIDGSVVHPRLLPLPLRSGQRLELLGRNWPPGCTVTGRR